MISSASRGAWSKLGFSRGEPTRQTRRRPAPGVHTKSQGLLLIGASGFAREAAEAVRAANAIQPTWELRGYLDDDPTVHGAAIGGLHVLGPIEAVSDYPDARVLICTGRPANYVSRRKIVERLSLDDERYATVIHPAATMGTRCQVGAGSVLLSHVDATTDVHVGRHVAIMPHAVLTHDVRVDDFATVASGVLIGGSCHIGEEAYLGSGACLRESLTVGDRAMIGMGSVVTRDVPSERLWYGTPARDVSPSHPKRPSHY